MTLRQVHYFLAVADDGSFTIAARKLRIAQPSLSLSGSAMSFSGTAGSGNPAAQTAGVSNSGTGTMSWTTSSNQSWLAVSPASGSDAGTISVQPNLSGLAAGTYTGTVTVTAPGATNSPKTIAVTFNVAAAPAPALSVSTASLSFSGTAGSRKNETNLVN